MRNVFEEESEVRSYCRSFPTVFNRAKMSKMYAENGDEYLDFFCCAGSLNYGHNNGKIITPIVEYISNDGIIQGMDMWTTTKKNFLETFIDEVLDKRGLEYKVLFPGPTGTNAIEAALKIARKSTGRRNVMAFMGAFHGMTLGSLSLTTSQYARSGAGVDLQNVTHIPFPFGKFEQFDTLGYLEAVLEDDHSGVERPAAIFLETIQAEGGVVVAPIDWLKRLKEICDKHGILLVCDEIQVGCGRTGNFFSFERAGIKPDIVTLSKSISGCGLPMSMVLLKPELDVFGPGQHNGTFRGNQLAFIGGRAGIEYMVENNLLDKVKDDGNFIEDYIVNQILPLADGIKSRGIGMIWGIDFGDVKGENLANRISKRCFENKLIIETCGRNDTVLKILPALTISREELSVGMDIVKKAIKNVI